MKQNKTFKKENERVTLFFVGKEEVKLTNTSTHTYTYSSFWCASLSLSLSLSLLKGPPIINVRGGWKNQRQGSGQYNQQAEYAGSTAIQSGTVRNDPFARGGNSDVISAAPRSRVDGRGGGGGGGGGRGSEQRQQQQRTFADSSASEDEHQPHRRGGSRRGDAGAADAGAAAAVDIVKGAMAEFDQVEHGAAASVGGDTSATAGAAAADIVRGAIVDFDQAEQSASAQKTSRKGSFSMLERAEEDERIAREENAVAEEAAQRKAKAKERARIRIAQEVDAAEAEREADTRRADKLERKAAEKLEKKAIKERARAAELEAAAAVAADDNTAVAEADGDGPDVCNLCSKKCDAKLCSGCFAVGYCSPECQRSDWKKHKKKCKRLAAELAASQAAKAEAVALAAEDPTSPKASAWGDADDAGGGAAAGATVMAAAATSPPPPAKQEAMAEELDAAARVAAALAEVKSRRTPQTKLKKGQTAVESFEAPAASNSEDDSDDDATRAAAAAATVAQTEWDAAAAQAEAEAERDAEAAHAKQEKAALKQAAKDEAATAKQAAKAEAAAAKQAAKEEATAARKAKREAAKAAKEERRRSKAMDADDGTVDVTADGNERCEMCHSKKAWCMCEKKRGFAADVKGDKVDGFEDLEAKEVENAGIDSDADSADDGVVAAKKRRESDDSDDSDTVVVKEIGADGKKRAGTAGAFLKKKLSKATEKISKKLSSVGDALDEKYGYGASKKKDEPDVTDDGNARCPDCHSKMAWCMCEKKRGFAADQKGENVEGFEKLQAEERSNAVLDSDADSEDAAGMLEEQAAMEGKKQRRWSRGGGGSSKGSLPKKKSKGSTKSKKSGKKEEGSGGGDGDGSKGGGSDGTDWGDSDDSEDHSAKANPSSEHMDAFRRQLSGDVGEDESKKDLASLKQSKAAADDPNARCPRCHTKMAWCVCMDKKPSASSAKGKKGSVSIAGMDDVDSTTDPTSGKILNLGNTVRETSSDAAPETEKAKEKKRAGKAAAEKPEKPPQPILPELAADLAKQDFTSGPNVWDQQDGDADGDADGGEAGEAAGSVLSGSKAGMDEFFKEAAAAAGEAVDVETALPSHLLLPRSASGGGGSAPSSGGLFVKPAKRTVRQLSDSEDSDEDGTMGITRPKKGADGGGSGNDNTGSGDGNISDDPDGVVNLLQNSKRESDKLTAGLFSDVPNDTSNMIRRKKKDSALPPGMLKKVKATMSGPMSRASASANSRVVNTSDNEDDGPTPNIPTLKKGRIVDKMAATDPDAAAADADVNASSIVYPTPDDVGKRVHVKGYGTGQLAFLGPVKFADKSTGDWCGVVLDEPNGKNDGSVQGIRYFDCKEKTGGVFVSLRTNKAMLLTGGVKDDGTGRSGAWGGSTTVLSKSSRASTAASDAGSSGVPVKVAPIASKRVVVLSSSGPGGGGGQGGARHADGGDFYDGSASQQEQRQKGDGGGSIDKEDPFPELRKMPVGPGAAGPSEPNMFAPPGLGPLHMAANSGNYDELKRLIKRGQHDIDGPDLEGRAPLMHAVHQHHVECAELLLKEGADINLHAKDGSTALHEAVYNSTVEMMWLLLNNGADVRSRDQDGREPVHWATDNPSGPKCMTVLLSKYRVDVNVMDDADMTPLMWAACHNQAPMVRHLLDLSADIHEKDMDEKSALDWAVHTDSIDALNLLLDYEGTFFKDRKGRTAMHTAAERGAVLAIEAILAVRPESIEDVDRQGRTPIFWSAACNQSKSLRILLSHGANVFAQDRSGLTCVQYAAAKEYIDIVQTIQAFQTNLQKLGLSQVVAKTREGTEGEAEARNSNSQLAQSITMVPNVSAPGGGESAHGGASDLLAGIAGVGLGALAGALPPDAIVQETEARRIAEKAEATLLAERMGPIVEEDEPAAKIKPKKLVYINREVEKFVTSEDSSEPNVTAGMLHEDCVKAVVHPRGRVLGKYSGVGDGKCHQRFFRITAVAKPGQAGHCNIIWSKTAENIEKGVNVSVAGLTGVSSTCEGTAIERRPDYSRKTTFAFLIQTTQKTLYLNASSNEERECWVRALNFILHG